MMSREEMEVDLRFLDDRPDKAELGDRACGRWPKALTTAIILLDARARALEVIRKQEVVIRELREELAAAKVRNASLAAALSLPQIPRADVYD